MTLILLLGQNDLYNDLYQEINRQNTFYFWIIGIVLTVSIAITAFIGILQWRLSNSQIEKLKTEIKKKLTSQYELDQVPELLQRLSKVEKELQKYQEMLRSRDVSLVSELNDTMTNVYDHDPAKAAMYTNKVIRLMSEIFGSEFIEDSAKAVTAFNAWATASRLSQNNNAKRIVNYLEKDAKKYLNLGRKLFNSPDLTNKN